MLYHNLGRRTDAVPVYGFEIAPFYIYIVLRSLTFHMSSLVSTLFYSPCTLSVSYNTTLFPTPFIFSLIYRHDSSQETPPVSRIIHTISTRSSASTQRFSHNGDFHIQLIDIRTLHRELHFIKEFTYLSTQLARSTISNSSSEFQFPNELLTEKTFNYNTPYNSHNIVPTR